MGPDAGGAPEGGRPGAPGGAGARAAEEVQQLGRLGGAGMLVGCVWPLNVGVCWACPVSTPGGSGSRESRRSLGPCACTCSVGAHRLTKTHPAMYPEAPESQIPRALPPQESSLRGAQRVTDAEAACFRRAAVAAALLGVFFAVNRAGGTGVSTQRGRRRPGGAADSAGGPPGANMLAQYFTQPPLGHRGRGASAGEAGAEAAPLRPGESPSRGGRRGEGGASGSFAGRGHRLGGS